MPLSSEELERKEEREGTEGTVDEKGGRDKEKERGRKRKCVCVCVCVCVCLNRDWRSAKGALHQYGSFSGQDTWDGL